MGYVAPPVPRSRNQNTRPKRWARACTHALGALEYLEEELPEEVFRESYLVTGFETLHSHVPDITVAMVVITDGVSEIESLQEEYQEWYDNMPEHLQEGDTGQALSAIGEISIPELNHSTLEELRDWFNEIEGQDLPRGFGR